MPCVMLSSGGKQASSRSGYTMTGCTRRACCLSPMMAWARTISRRAVAWVALSFATLLMCWKVTSSGDSHCFWAAPRRCFASPCPFATSNRPCGSGAPATICSLIETTWPALAGQRPNRVGNIGNLASVIAIGDPSGSYSATHFSPCRSIGRTSAIDPVRQELPWGYDEIQQRDQA